MSTSPERSPNVDFSRAAPTLVARFADLPAANVSDVMQRMGAVDPRIRPIWDGAAVVGTAFTVWTRAGDNASVHEALEHARPGDVVVVNAGGDESRAIIGELMGGLAKSRGVKGFVIDGAVRDAGGLAEYQVPVFARSVTPAGAYKDGPGVLAGPVAIGGVVVFPGDIIVADADGVVVVPRRDGADIADRAEAKRDSENARRDAIEEALRAQ